MPRQKFHKITCIGHTVMIDDEGEIIGDLQSDPITCRTLEEMNEFFVRVKSDIQTYNDAQPNRAQRRQPKAK